MKKNPQRVLVAMSGGVDSSVAALLLVRQGYEVIGATMKLWGGMDGKVLNSASGCCSLDSIYDAKAVCTKLGIPHQTIDFSDQFKDKVIDNFVSEYLGGRTPNPCVQCNIHIKWDSFLSHAEKMGADLIATGHYARIVDSANGSELHTGVDQAKDQSYALWGISQKALDRTLLPVGDFTKPEIRRIATEAGLPTAQTPESMEICFIPDNDYRGFLKRATGIEFEEGKIVDSQGAELGMHGGYPFYTIGQRRGLGVATGNPAYVTDINHEENLLVLGSEDDLYKSGLEAVECNWFGGFKLNSEFQALVKIRYHHEGVPAKVLLQDGKTSVRFTKPARSITPGQSVVFYQGTRVIGGGIIASAIEPGTFPEDRSQIA